MGNVIRDQGLEGFIKDMKEAVESIYKGTREIRVKADWKNNGKLKRALIIVEEGRTVFKAFYLEDYFCRYREGEGLERLAVEIVEENERDKPEEGITECLKDFSWVKERLVCAVANAGWNQERLKGVPHIRVMDLAVVFHVDLKDRDGDPMKALVHYEHMELWGAGMEEVAAQAIRNTRERYPARRESLLKIMMGMEEKDFLEEGQALRGEVCCLNTTRGCYGAIAMLYPGVLKEIAEEIKSDLVILPSNIHECIAVPYDGRTDIRRLEGTVRAINRTMKDQGEVLSDHVYLYERKGDTLYLVGDGGERERGFFLEGTL